MDKVKKDGLLIRYPKVQNLYNVEVGTGVWAANKVAVQEKLHGTQGRIMVTADEVYTGTRRARRTDSSQGFAGQYDLQIEIGNRLQSELYGNLLDDFDIQLFGEYAGPGVQKGVYYGDEKRFYVFDVVLVSKDTGDLVWFDAYEVLNFCHKYRLDMVPVVYVGEPSKEAFDRHYDAQSTVAIIEGDNVVEGVVIKSMPVMFDDRGDIVYAKHKNARFAEKAATPKQKIRTEYDTTIAQYVTEARLLHAIERLKEQGNFTGEMSDMQHLPKMVIDDIIEEEGVVITDKTMRRNVNKVATRVIAKMYKSMLMGESCDGHQK